MRYVASKIYFLGKIILLCSLLILLSIILFLVSNFVSIKRIDLTDEILRKGQFNLTDSFEYTRACLFPAEDLTELWVYDNAKSYKRIDDAYADETFYWIILIIDDGKKTITKRIVSDKKLKYLGPRKCAHRVNFSVEKTDQGNIVQVQLSN